MTTKEKVAGAKKFKAKYLNRGSEKSDAQSFWIDLLTMVFGVEDATDYIRFEKEVSLSHTSFIDGYISATKILIEQKSSTVDLLKPEKQSDGSLLTPFEQAKRYASHLRYTLNPRWIIVSNFKEFHVYDMDQDVLEPYIISLADIDEEYYRLEFIIDQSVINIKKQYRVSKEAGDLVGEIYDALAKQYINPEEKKSAHSLNVLCVRLVFCLYAEDAGLFEKDQFKNYLNKFTVSGMRNGLIELFKVLDTPKEKRDPYSEAKDFPYVNGGLFEDTDIIIPQLTEDIKHTIIDKASSEFDWRNINPTIFGALFESTLNPETRHNGGMHYTSVENIHKVIDPLFLNNLRDELNSYIALPRNHTWRKRHLISLHNRISNLTFFDPACGSGNFLTETYISLRKMENQILTELQYYIGIDENQISMLETKDSLNIKVSINNFYGIEINDFAVSVARTAMWIAESQMLQETLNLMDVGSEFLPLRNKVNIYCDNAITKNWSEVISPTKLNYIMGNPPFLGARKKTDDQKADIKLTFGKDWECSGDLDYVSCWYKKAADYMKGTEIKAALVSTNSICQGETPYILWKPLICDMGIIINYGYKTFRWDSEAKIKAHVHCVIVGFSYINNSDKFVVESDGTVSQMSYINAYLSDLPDIYVRSRTEPYYDVPQIGIGNKPVDHGYYLFKPKEKDAFIKKEPKSAVYFKKWIGADEFIKGKERWCLWLGDCTPEELIQMPECIKLIEQVRLWRMNEGGSDAKKLANTPTRFHVENIPHSDYLVIPRVSSETRTYVPIGFMTPDTLPSDAVHVGTNATIYQFGVLTSSIHNAWMRYVCGRLKSDYRYSKEIVYNNFPWPNPTDEQRKAIEISAQKILDARAVHSTVPLSDLYDVIKGKGQLFSDVVAAHNENDKAVMVAYGYDTNISDREIVIDLMKRYQQLLKMDLQES